MTYQCAIWNGTITTFNHYTLEEIEEVRKRGYEVYIMKKDEGRK